MVTYQVCSGHSLATLQRIDSEILKEGSTVQPTTFACYDCGRSLADFLPCPSCRGDLIWETDEHGKTRIRNYCIERLHAAEISGLPAHLIEHFEWQGKDSVTTWNFDQADGVLERTWNKLWFLKRDTQHD